PKVYLRDSGILHSLLAIPDHNALVAHPRAWASWEGFVIEQVIELLQLRQVYFWATYQGAELDLLFTHAGRPYGIEVKYNESPTVTRSMRSALEDLGLEHLWVIHPGPRRFPADARITMWPAAELAELPLP
ncbi:MAG: DUF4143 domain-containing protein, partial [Candidatus Eisenbacteria bacterium]|nr:DUF4143 domain-containing protein [Candidatus Eisenbacteria bacterium]